MRQHQPIVHEFVGVSQCPRIGLEKQHNNPRHNKLAADPTYGANVLLVDASFAESDFTKRLEDGSAKNAGNAARLAGT